MTATMASTMPKKNRAHKIEAGFYEYRGFYLLQFTTRMFSQNYRSAPKNALIGGGTQWHIFRHYMPELDEGRTLEAGNSAGVPYHCGLAVKAHSVFGHVDTEGFERIAEAKEYVDDLYYAGLVDAADEQTQC